MATAFVVTAGDYSNYHIVAVFSTREKAEWLVKAYKASNEPSWYKDEVDIQEWDIDELADEPSLRTAYHCRMMMLDGTIAHEWREQRWCGRNQRTCDPEEVETHDGFAAVETESLVSSEHAAKLAVEYRQKKLALDALGYTMPTRLLADVPEHRNYDVYLDGNRLDTAIEADSREGWVRVYVVARRDEDGEPYFKLTRDPNGEPTFKTEVVRGKVEFRKREPE